MASLRERKKAETRQRITDVATPMFVLRGFDNVTINEIAEAAGVSKVTVFNYFPRKEDIFFDRFPEAMELLTRAIRDRDPDETPVHALRRLFVGQAGTGHPLGGFQNRFVGFWQTIVDSAALRARVREFADELHAHLAELIRETSDDPDPDLTAALVLAAYRTVFTNSVARLFAGTDAAEVTTDYLAGINRAFDRLAEGVS